MMTNKQKFISYFLLILSVCALSCKKPEPTPLVNAPERLLIFGIDAVSWEVLQPLCDAGYLPEIQKLISEGTSCRLKTLDPTVSVMLWTTIATGVMPEKHGISNWLSEGSDTSGQLAITSNLRQTAAFWNLDSSLKQLVVNWWATWPAETINGVMISNRDHFPKLESTVYPADYKSQSTNITRMNRSDMENELSHFNPNGNAISLNDFMFSQLQRDRYYLDLAHHLLQKESFDIVALFSRGTDILEHEYLRDVIDDHRIPEVPDEQKGIVISYYRFLDDQLRKFREEMGENCTVVLVSDHGMDPVIKLPPFIEGLNLDALMESTGLNRWTLPDDPESSTTFRDNKQYPPGLHRGISIQAGTHNNITGPALEYLKIELSQITFNGKPLFEHIQITPSSNEVIALTISPDPSPGDVLKYRDKTVPVMAVTAMVLHPRSGQHWHSPDGIFVISGPGIVSQSTRGSIGILDVMPTFAGLMGIPISRDLDGKPREDFFSMELKALRPPEYVDTYAFQQQDNRIQTDQGVEKVIKNELKSLGYIQ